MVVVSLVGFRLLGFVGALGVDHSQNELLSQIVCVCLLLQYLIQSCARGGRRIVEDMCYEIRRAEACVD
jgi:hypothetical protein